MTSDDLRWPIPEPRRGHQRSSEVVRAEAIVRGGPAATAQGTERHGRQGVHGKKRGLVSIFYLRGPVLWPVSSYVATLFRRRTAVALQPSGAATGPLASLIGAVGTRRSVRRRVGTGNNSHHSRRAVYTADRLSVYSDVNFSLHFGTRAARANRGHKRFRHAHHSQHPRRCRAPDGRD